jgi:phosphatidylinositol alpha 1,6-mannosyltransferase
VIAPRSGGPVDHVQDGKNGFLFKPDDIKSMIFLVKQLVSDPALTKQLAEGSRSYAEKQNWEEILSELLEHYIYVTEHSVF